MEIRKKYQELQKKYKLPKFEDINNDFEITLIEDKDFLLREIRRKMAEKTEFLIRLFEGTLQPETTIVHFHESKIFTAEEREKVYDLYRKLMFFHRFSIETAIDESDTKTANFINTFWNDWTKIKKESEEFVKKIKESWKEDTELKEELNYMG